MSDENSNQLKLSVSMTAPDSADQLDKVGEFVLALILQAAGLAREVSGDEHKSGVSSREQIEALEARIGQYQDLEQQTALCGTLLTEAQRKLRDRSEEAQDSYRRFVDAAA